MNLNTNPIIRAPQEFQGQLSSNEVFSALYNMIIGVEVFSDNIKGLYDSLLNRYTADAGLFGDRKLYISTDCLETIPWTGDGEASNLLNLHRPKDPKVQEVIIDQFRMIPLTTDQYLTKRAFSDEGTFGQFNSVIKSWMADTKKVYMSKLVNAYVGTVEGDAEINELDITFTDNNGEYVDNQETPVTTTLKDKEAINRLNASAIAEAIANLTDEMKDAERDYNSYGFLRSYAPEDLVIVWNSKYVNTIKYVDLPTVFHKDGLEPAVEEKLPAKYFGHNVTADDIGSGKVIKVNGEIDTTKGTVRVKYEKSFTFEGNKVHYFPGDKLPAGVKVSYTGGSVANPDVDETEVYVEDDTIIAKILHKRSIPFLQAFSTGTEFWNPRSLTTNNYSIWGYGELTYLSEYPLITVKKA